MREPILAVVLLLVAGCGSGPAPLPSAGPIGHVEIALEIAPDATRFFASQHRARVIDAEGAVVAEWELTEAAAPVAVPAGTVLLQGFTVFLSDFLACSPDPAAPGTAHCQQPTLGPAKICAISVQVAAGSTLHARYRSLPQGDCELVDVSGPAGS